MSEHSISITTIGVSVITINFLFMKILVLVIYPVVNVHLKVEYILKPNTNINN